MSDVILFSSPGTCARVTSVALEEIGIDYEVRLVRLMAGEHRTPEFLKVNPKAKVPALRIGNAILTENVAIVTYLHAEHPEAGLLPPASDRLEAARQLIDLCFCSSTLHPIVSRLGVPQFFAGPENKEVVWKKGAEALSPYFSQIDERFSDQPWWYGERWSIVDAYVFWIFERSTRTGFDAAPFPHYAAHAERIRQRTSVQKALAREAIMMEHLTREGLLSAPQPAGR